jgi:hypothetical protein
MIMIRIKLYIIPENNSKDISQKILFIQIDQLIQMILILIITQMINRYQSNQMKIIIRMMMM